MCLCVCENICIFTSQSYDIYEIENGSLEFRIIEVVQVVGNQSRNKQLIYVGEALHH